jgi:uncharacterized protein YfaS (alpha-2-macroglobulin family)
MHRLAWVWGIFALLLGLLPAPARATTPSPEDRPALWQAVWSDIDRLIADGRLEEASKKLEAMLRTVRTSGDEENWTRVLVYNAQIHLALHKTEGAVRFLQEEPWPSGAVSRSVLDLFFAHSLATYARAYFWEIELREQVESSQTVDLKHWTREQIRDAAVAAYLDLWSRREELGELPVARWDLYLEANEYPAEIRGTLRDAVSYFFVDLLADSSLWSAQENLEVDRLDLPSLIRGEGASTHPLERLSSSLGDLERWHAAAGRREAALEARRERLRRLYAAFTKVEDRRLIRRDLEESLAAARDLPWWSMGMATLAEFTMVSEAPDRLAQAHRIAAEGQAADPTSPGGLRCGAVRDQIEAPEFALTAMKSDGLGRRSIRVSHRNLPALFFRAYSDDPDEPRDSIGPSKVEELLRSGQPAAVWRVELPETPDFELHTTWVVPPMDRPGAYVILASPREDFPFEEAKSPIQAVRLLLGDLVLAVRSQQTSGDLDVLALSGATGEPVAGAEVRLEQLPASSSTDSRRIETKTADAGGALRFNLEKSGQVLLFGRHDDEPAFASTYAYPAGDGDAEITDALLYTDRAVYRPQQKILWKVLAYRGREREGRFAAAAGAAVTVTLYDPNHQKVAAQTVTTNAFGTSSGEFAIPPGHPLGTWWLESAESSAQVNVEEYKRPTFEVTLADPATPLRLNRPAKLTGKALYYFGLPVTGGEVRWRVTRQPFFPQWWYGDVEGSETAASGISHLSPEGTFEIDFTPQGDEWPGPEVTWGFTIAAEVTDEGGETREAERSFRLGKVSIEAKIDKQPAFLRAGRKASLAVVRSDLNGVPRPGAGAWTLYELRQPEKTFLPSELPPEPMGRPVYRTPGDELSPRWPERTYSPADMLRSWEDGRRIAAGELRHDAAGKAVASLPALPPGAYRLRYETVDDFGARVESQRELIAAGTAGTRTPLALPAVLEVETPTIRVGETARVLVHSGLPGQALYFEIDRDGEPIARRTLRSGESPSLIEIPIGEKDRGGLAFKLLMLRDHQLFVQSATVQVPWDDRELKVRFATFRDKIRPGSHETWRVTVQGAGGAPEARTAEILAAVTDRSLDLFAPYEPPSPLQLYPRRDQVSGLTASVGFQYPFSWGLQRRGVLPSPRPDRLRFFDGIGKGRARLGEMTGTGDHFSQDLLVVADMPVLDARRISTAATVSRESPAYYDFDAFEESQVRPSAVRPVRSNFSETALWQPHLLTGPDGAAILELSVPDSVTSWNVWLQAVTRDLRAGGLRAETRSVKELLVRPYLPRFLREGDRAELKVVVNNAAGRTLRGEVTIDLFDPETNESLLADFGLTPGGARLPFTVAAGGGTSVTFPLTVPHRDTPVAFKVTAVSGKLSGELSDGELRSLPVLPARIELMQSRFAMLRGGEQRTLRFEDLEKNDDPTRRTSALVVTVDGQLFDGVLAALPYLVEYPYECAEQTLNRFLSTGIVTRLFDQYPAVARKAAELAQRETPLEVWDAGDPNRKLMLEETPFLQLARGGPVQGKESRLLKVLDPRIVRAEREAALAKLAQMQLPSGAFPWWPGGPESPYMTAYLLYGFAKASEFGLEIPRDMVRKGWTYLSQYLRGRDPDEDVLIFINYIASAYPDPSWMGDALKADDRARILDSSFARWQALSPYLKSLLALTLKRMGRIDDAQLVFDSVLDRAQTTQDEGTFWQPEGRSWLWSNDTIESHAFALYTLMELRPDDPRRHGLVQWLFLNKQLNHWQSTRATAEVLYALVHYLQAEGQLGVREAATVRVGGRTTSFVFDPDRFTGKENRIVISGDKIDPADSAVVIDQETPGFLYAAATWHFSTEEPPKEDRGDLFQISRRYFLRLHNGAETVLRPLAAGAVLKPGDEVEVQLSLRSRAAAEYVHLRDPRPAGLEPGAARSGWKWDLGLSWYEETHDSATSFFFERLPAGEYTFKYRLHADLAGTFCAGPATVQSMYAPEFAAYSAGDVLRVEGGPGIPSY